VVPRIEAPRDEKGFGNLKLNRNIERNTHFRKARRQMDWKALVV
jgi:G:T-mismatch repair DNA endonuclease (very short patch repair protein)